MNPFIENEKKFFEPILNNSINTTESMKAQFRKETILERKIRINKELYHQLSGIVQYGPFKGMSISSSSWWNNCDIGAMLLGLYEPHILSQIYSNEFSQLEYFVDIGAADGYYVNGCLYSKRFKKAIAFEQSDEGSVVINKNAMLNGIIDKLQINKKADQNFYQKIPQDFNLSKTLFLIDVEGDEFKILDSTSLKKLRNSTIIIEIHNWLPDFWKQYENFMIEASEYFNISAIQSKKIDINKYPELYTFPDDSKYLLLSEGRPNLMRFLKLSPK